VRARTFVVACVVPALVAAGGAVASTATTAAPAPARGVGSAAFQVGSRTLHRCSLGLHRPTWCGHLRVALNPAVKGSPTIGVGFGWLPARRSAHSDPTADATTIVAQEGGPGYPSTGTAADFTTLFGPLLEDHNLLVVDARGTGRSDAVDCPRLQTQAVKTASRRFRTAVNACARQLNHTYRNADGSYVHASNLFGTAYAVRDMSRVIKSLGLGKIDLYGDSYGTYFAQSFLSYYPRLVSAVVLDSAYEAKDLDPWYRTTVTTMRRAFNLVCTRSLACSTRGTGTSAWGEISRLARRLRAAPVSGVTTGDDGRPTHIRVGLMALLNMVNDAGYDYQPYRDLYAAARAYLRHGDSSLLLRLYAQDVGYDYGDYSAPAPYYSDGLFMAVACTDYPQLYSMRADPAHRRRQLDRAVAALPTRTFAPFTTREWIRMLPYTETYTGCLTWPRTPRRTLPVIAPGVPFSAGHTPVLILNGDIDSLTPAAGGRHVARQLGPSARSIVVKNMVHLVGLYDPFDCGAPLVRRFLRDPQRLATLDARCGNHIPEVHALGRIRSTVRPTARSQASMALNAAGDAASRWDYISGTHDTGLRGGAVRYRQRADGRIVARLSKVRWATNAWVSGRVVFTEYGLAAHSRLTIHADGRVSRFRAHWRTTGPHTRASVVLDGRRLSLPAP
jgi:pimeloyl-ACP methyl ester carboxylesterase